MPLVAVRVSAVPVIWCRSSLRSKQSFLNNVSFNAPTSLSLGVVFAIGKYVIDFTLRVTGHLLSKEAWSVV